MNDEKDNFLDAGQIRVTKPFGPSIAQVRIPQTLIKKLNDYVDKIIENKKKASDLDMGKELVGNVSQEFMLEKSFAEEIGWVDFLKRGVSAWITHSDQKKITKFEIIDTWVVRQFKGEYNPVHWHAGHITGVGYLKVPKTLGEPVQKEVKYVNINGHLQLVHGTRMFLSNSKLNIKPEVGDFYFFPNYMMHSVYPFANTEEERRSISFNARIDEDIYNVYG